MTTKYTPGPWRVVRSNPSPTTGEWMVAGAKPGYLAEVRDCGSGNVEANARLIAAAPDLLAALEAAMSQLEFFLKRDPDDDTKQAYVDARDAIAKAKGIES